MRRGGIRRSIGIRWHESERTFRADRQPAIAAGTLAEKNFKIGEMQWLDWWGSTKLRRMQPLLTNIISARTFHSQRKSPVLGSTRSAKVLLHHQPGRPAFIWSRPCTSTI